ncbi:MAG: MFS transporter [Victivallales bacterium]|nr:MFS transporter [Victivallales bacterium]
MEKQRLSILKIINMSIGFMGIQFGWGLQMANMSAIYSYLGAKPDQIPILWLAAPLTGLIVQPIIGQMSDNTWCRLGRRRPYFLIGAILASIALFGMPYSGTLIMAASFLWILDTSVNISMGPFRAFVADLLPEDQRTLGYSVQTLFVSVGAVTASAFPWLLTNVFHFGAHQTNVGASGAATLHSMSPAHHTYIYNLFHEAFANKLPYIIKFSFHFGAVIFIVCVLYTIFTVKENPPADMEAFRKLKEKAAGLGSFFKEIGSGIVNMPETMRKLAWVQFFTWMGLFLMWIYFGIAVGHLFGKTGSEAYLNGVEWAGMCFACYNLVSLIYSFLMPGIAKKITRKWTHIISLLIGSVCMIAVLFPSTGGSILFLKIFTISLMVGIGIAWGSTLTMPYAILSSHIPEKKMGFYMGVFNFFITIPQIISAVGFGWLMLHLFNNNRQWGVACGGICWIIAAIMMLRIKESKK